MGTDLAVMIAYAIWLRDLWARRAWSASAIVAARKLHPIAGLTAGNEEPCDINVVQEALSDNAVPAGGL